jgi:hypothetical protein
VATEYFGKAFFWGENVHWFGNQPEIKLCSKWLILSFAASAQFEFM